MIEDKGLNPYASYAVDISPDVAPKNSEFKLTFVVGGVWSTKLTFYIKNLASDTLRFPFTKSDDKRAIQIKAKRLSYIYIKKWFNITLNDSPKVIPLKDFDDVIVIPPNESVTYEFVFEKFGVEAAREFSIVSEDKELNQTFLIFKNIKL